MKDLELLKRCIIESGSITADDVSNLRGIVYHNGKVEQEEAEFLFSLKKEMYDFGNLKEWNSFFIQAICDFILDDDRSPEAVDDNEAKWLINQIGEDNIIDDVEKKLLSTLHSKAKYFPNDIKEIQKHTSITKSLGKRIFLMLCGNTKTLRALEYGITCTGQKKPNPFHQYKILSENDDDHH